MDKKLKLSALSSPTLMSLVLAATLSTSSVKAAVGEVSRMGEANRYATAAKVATTNWSTSDDVILVSGEGYADAVSASALAKKLNAPILLTTSAVLNTETKTALDTLKPKNVYVIGGNASVSQSVRDKLKEDKYTLIELSGATRYETNTAVADKLVTLGVDPAEVIMVGGQGFSDALSVAPIAAAKGQILLLGTTDLASINSVSKFVNDHNSKVTVVGTKNVIPDAVLNSFKDSSRIDGGTDRFDTNLKVLSAFKDDIKMDKIYMANASGNGYADALVASALSGKYAAPLVLLDDEASASTTNAINFIKTNIAATSDLQAVGGTGVIPEALITKINAIIPKTDDNDDNDDTATTMPKATIDTVNTDIPFTTIVKISLDTTTPEKYNVTVNGTAAELKESTAGEKSFVAVLDNTYTQDELTVTVTAK